MKILSAPQWIMLIQANSPKGVFIEENLNTITALYTRDLVNFETTKNGIRIAPTELGRLFLKRRKRLLQPPSHKTGLKKGHELRGN